MAHYTLSELERIASNPEEARRVRKLEGLETPPEAVSELEAKTPDPYEDTSPSIDPFSRPMEEDRLRTTEKIMMPTRQSDIIKETARVIYCIVNENLDGIVPHTYNEQLMINRFRHAILDAAILILGHKEKEFTPFADPKLYGHSGVEYLSSDSGAYLDTGVKVYPKKI